MLIKEPRGAYTVHALLISRTEIGKWLPKAPNERAYNGFVLGIAFIFPPAHC